MEHIVTATVFFLISTVVNHTLPWLALHRSAHTLFVPVLASVHAGDARRPT
jgi:formate hydrogenlyase subunit 4